jgi:hypothetical protein
MCRRKAPLLDAYPAVRPSAIASPITLIRMCAAASSPLYSRKLGSLCGIAVEIPGAQTSQTRGFVRTSPDGDGMEGNSCCVASCRSPFSSTSHSFPWPRLGCILRRAGCRTPSRKRIEAAGSLLCPPCVLPARSCPQLATRAGLFASQMGR